MLSLYDVVVISGSPRTNLLPRGLEEILLGLAYASSGGGIDRTSCQFQACGPRMILLCMLTLVYTRYEKFHSVAVISGLLGVQLQTVLDTDVRPASLALPQSSPNATQVRSC